MKTLVICAIVASTLGLAAAQAGACACSKQLCNLDAAESALYLDCVMTMQGAQLPVSFDFNAIKALDQLSAERQNDLLTTCHGSSVHTRSMGSATCNSRSCRSKRYIRMRAR